MAVNQLMQAHDEFFNGSGGAVTYGGWAPGATIIRTDGTIVSGGSGSSGPSEPSVPINVPPPTLFPVDFDGDYHNDFLYGTQEELEAENNYQGTDGFTIVSYHGAPAGVTASLVNPSINTGYAAGDTYGPSIEGLAGTSFNDRLYGNNLGNILYGGAGYDTLYGLGGNDLIVGGDGGDTLMGGAGADWLNGGTGFDYASYIDAAFGVVADLLDTSRNAGDAAGDAYNSIECLIGSGYNDELLGNHGYNELHGGDGDDVLEGRGGNDQLYGGAGYDFASYFHAAGSVVADLTDGTRNTGEALGDYYISIEALHGSQFGDGLFGNSIGNSLYGHEGDDWLYGREGRDYIVGGGGSDVLDGGSDADWLVGSSGYDYASYATATTYVVARLSDPAGNTGDAAGDTYDSIEGLHGSGFDDILGGDGAGNYLFGRAGNDLLRGESGNDVLFGEEGLDRLVGGAGADTMTGGASLDYFHFSGPLGAGNVDTVTDFTVGEDYLVLDRTAFTGIPTLFGYINFESFTIGGEARTESHRIIYNSATGDVFYDPDGTAAAPQIKFATLGKNLALTFDWIMLA